jgi:hypothetical protein
MPWQAFGLSIFFTPKVKIKKGRFTKVNRPNYIFKTRGVTLVFFLGCF